MIVPTSLSAESDLALHHGKKSRLLFHEQSNFDGKHPLGKAFKKL